MNVKFFTASFLCIVASFPAAAKVTLIVPQEVELLVADGVKPQFNSSFFASESTIELNDGEHQIAFRYLPVFKQGKDNIIVTSDVIVARFNASSDALTFQFPNYRDPKAAESFNKSVDWQLINAAGSKVDKVQGKLVHKGVQIGRNYEFEIAQFNTSHDPAALKSTSVTVTTSEMQQQSGDNTAEKMMHYWYKKADKETQIRFEKFLNNSH